MSDIPNLPPGVAAGSGGRGSFSYGDTSVYGDRQQKQIVSGQAIIPGGGGGAKPRNLRHGGKATGYNPNGVVVIRLTKID